MHRPWIRRLLFLAAWLLIGTLIDVHTYLNYSVNQGLAVRAILFWELPSWTLWAILSIPAYKLSEKFPVYHPLVFRNILIHLALSVPFALVHVTGNFLLNWSLTNLWSGEYISFFELTEGEFITRLPYRMLIYLLIVLGSHAIIFRKKILEQERRSAQLEAQVARAELESLKTQLQPHFLFNTLSTISELIHHERDLADQMVVSLGELLRRSLIYSGVQKITLAEELDILELYLSIQRSRFEELNVSLKVEDGAKKAKVPSLLLQPLIENAIKYGGVSSRKSCRIEITASVNAQDLLLHIYNDRQENGSHLSGTGVGLANTQERLKLLYGSECDFKSEQLSDDGFAVSIRIPAQYS